MLRPMTVPPRELARRRGPFTVDEARQAGLRWVDLQTSEWTRVGYGQYASSELPYDARLKLLAVAQRMPANYAFSGRTALWLLDLDPVFVEPIEVTISRDIPVRARAGVRLRRAAIVESEVIVRHGFRLTSAMRTACDLGSQRDLVEAVVAVDMTLHAGLVKLADLERHTSTNPGSKGIRRLRRAVRLAEPESASPPETRLRIHLIKGRLPRPSVQTKLYDTEGRFLGRVDLYYPDRKLAMEYDGANHKDRLDEDLARQNAILSAGFHLLRFGASDLRNPREVVGRVRRMRASLPKCRVGPDEHG